VGAALLAACCASASWADYPAMKVIPRPDGEFYKVPLALSDGSYQELEVELSPRRFLFCSEREPQRNPQAAALFDCAVERSGKVSMARIGLVPARSPDGSDATVPPFVGAEPPALSHTPDGKSWVHVPVSTLVRTLDSVDREWTDQHYLFCSKLRREGPQTQAPVYEIQCLVESGGHVSRTSETFAPTDTELAALHDFDATPHDDDATPSRPDPLAPFNAL
jgi:hypothetical protein